MSGITIAGSGTGPRPARPRNRRGEGSRLRAEILAAAAELLDADGDERAVTLRAVAHRVGIAAPSIYPHFHDRPALMLQVTRQAFAGLSVRIRSALDRAGDDPQERLDAACRAYLDFARDHPGRYRAMFGGAGNTPTASGRRPDLPAEQATRILTDFLTDCLAAGHHAGTDPATDAVALWLGLHGLAHQRAIAPAFPWPADIVQRLTSPLTRPPGHTHT
ncbi:TetR/AcrR family transcriptional regulator [Streptomyces dioscori]|uniref:TetR/AcrR family transcriptional regulator n=1 Tax=Streptomyces dioscori TaxID=2109333 RepID=A0A2P8QCH6_9ACTN|nr:TetR-like C-terminal domain-containing protein [Streptomyces dioscori]PSM43924.1 TetR/AcrR family transcriptional regulator [Streptomyces dioscori]